MNVLRGGVWGGMRGGFCGANTLWWMGVERVEGVMGRLGERVLRVRELGERVLGGGKEVISPGLGVERRRAAQHRRAALEHPRGSAAQRGL